VGNFVPDPGANWSKSAGQAASMARAAYRALNGASRSPLVQTTVHPLNETDGSLNLANLAFTASVKRALANDVTVCGENEPVAYVTEYFLGDGVTTEFNLAADPYFPAERNPQSSASSSTSHRSTRRCGRFPRRRATCYDGTRRPGDERRQRHRWRNLLMWLDPIEMGGTLLLEAVGVTLSPGSTGILADSSTAWRTQRMHRGFQATAQQGTGP
jgi:hypothetical protein